MCGDEPACDNGRLVGVAGRPCVDLGGGKPGRCGTTPASVDGGGARPLSRGSSPSVDMAGIVPGAPIASLADPDSTFRARDTGPVETDTLPVPRCVLVRRARRIASRRVLVRQSHPCVLVSPSRARAPRTRDRARSAACGSRLCAVRGATRVARAERSPGGARSRSAPDTDPSCTRGPAAAAAARRRRRMAKDRHTRRSAEEEEARRRRHTATSRDARTQAVVAEADRHRRAGLRTVRTPSSTPSRSAGAPSLQLRDPACYHACESVLQRADRRFRRELREIMGVPCSCLAHVCSLGAGSCAPTSRPRS